MRTPDEAWSQEFDFASKQMGRFRYVAGLFGFYNKVREHDDYNSGVFTDDTTIKNTSYAGFAEGTVDITDQLSAILGVRVNHDKLEAEGSYFGGPQAIYAREGMDLDDARAVMQEWRKGYSEVHPHRVIGNKPPKTLVNGPSTKIILLNPAKIKQRATKTGAPHEGGDLEDRIAGENLATKLEHKDHDRGHGP